MQITLYTQTFVLPHLCRILYLLYMVLNVLGLNLDHPEGDIYLDTTQSVGLLWTSDRPVAETST